MKCRASIRPARKDLVADLAEFVTARTPTARRSTRPASGQGRLATIGKAADTDFNQFALAQVVVHQAEIRCRRKT